MLSKHESLPADLSQQPDSVLLAAYQRSKANDAFVELVRRHVDWIYAAAFRQTQNRALATDVTISLFVVLAQHPSTLCRQKSLLDWLFRAVRFAAMDARSLARTPPSPSLDPADAVQASTSSDPTVWTQLAPILDETLAALPEKNRQALLLRFFQKRGFSEIGAILQGDESSARRQVVLGLEELCRQFEQRGLTLTVITLTALLVHHCVEVAPLEIATYVLTPAGRQSSRAPLDPLIQSLNRRLFPRRTRPLVPIMVGVVLLVGGIAWAIGQWNVSRQQRAHARQAERATIVANISATVAAIERALKLNQPDRLAQLVHFGTTTNDAARGVFLAYLRAASAFRQSLQTSFSDQSLENRSYTLTLNQLLEGQPRLQSGPEQITATRATDNTFQTHSISLTNIAGAWKWAWADGFVSEARRQERLAALQRQTAVLDALTEQIQEGRLTSIEEIFRKLAAPVTF